jgi:hypothetical protein
MIELTYKDLFTPEFKQAIGKLAESSNQDFPDLKKFLGIYNKVDIEFKKASSLSKKLMEKHCVWEDEEAKKPKVEGSAIVWKDSEAFFKDEEQLLAEKFNIQLNKLPTDSLLKAGLNAKELLAIAPIVEDLPN